MKKGFTLVEIMVVIVIMGILAAVGVPKLFGQIENARIANDIQALNAVKTAVVVASVDDAFQQALSHTFKVNNNTTGVMRMRISWSSDKSNYGQEKYAIQTLVVDAIKSNAGSEFIELGAKITNNKDNKDGRIAAVYQSKLLQQKQLDMMILITEHAGHFKICVLPTDAMGKATSINVFTYRGKPVAAGDIPKDGESWNGKVSFKYKPLED